MAVHRRRPRARAEMGRGGARGGRRRCRGDSPRREALAWRRARRRWRAYRGERQRENRLARGGVRERLQESQLLVGSVRRSDRRRLGEGGSPDRGASMTVIHHRWDDITPEQINSTISRQYITAERVTMARFELKRGAVVP